MQHSGWDRDMQKCMLHWYLTFEQAAAESCLISQYVPGVYRLEVLHLML